MPDRTTQNDSSWINGHQEYSYASNIGRGNTSASVLFTIPARSTMIGLQVSGPKSNAGTSATLSLGSTGGGGSEFLAAYDLKNVGNVSVPSSAVLGFVNDANPIQITGTVAEAGGASTSGGPWMVVVTVI